MRSVALRPIPELASPLPLLAVALLAANDHLLKHLAPGPVTGKLSDLAGCFVLPLFLSAALAVLTSWPLRRRLALGAAATALAFAALKLSPPVAAAVSWGSEAVWRPVLGGRGRILADGSDLVALPLVLLAVAYGRRAARRKGATP